MIVRDFLGLCTSLLVLVAWGPGVWATTLEGMRAPSDVAVAVVSSTPIAAAPDPGILVRIDQVSTLYPVVGMQTPIALRTIDSLRGVPGVIDAKMVSPQTPREVFRAALAESWWPITDWALVERRVACESGFDPRKRGDGGASVGYLMIHVPAHPDIAVVFDLEDPVQNLNAGRMVAQRAAAAGLPSPWLYCDREAAR